MENIVRALFMIVILSNAERVKSTDPPSTCPEAPSWGQWTSWNECPAECNEKGTRFRERECMYSDCPDGTPCIGEWKEQKHCYGRCTETTTLGPYSEWSECDAECYKMGRQYRERECMNMRPYPMPAKCYVPLYLGRDCRRSCCPDGQPAWSEWTMWTSCEPSCGLGTQTRSRECQGEDLCVKYYVCPGEFHEQRRCFSWCCGEENVELGQWTPWSGCSSTCEGQDIRTRTCTATNCTREAEQCADLSKQVRECLLFDFLPSVCQRAGK